MFADCPPRWNDDYAAPRPSAGVFDSPAIPICLNTEWASHLDGLLEQLLCPAYWQGTDEEVEAATQQVGELLTKLGQIETCPTEVRVHYIGEPFSKFTATAPVGALPMDGTPRLQADYPDLMPEIPTSWKDGDYFTLPDMSSRGLVGANFQYLDSAGQPVSVIAGDVGGEISHTLTYGEMPMHNHQQRGNANQPLILENGATGQTSMAGGGNAGAPVTPNTTAMSGSNEPHNNMSPFLAAHWFIQAE